MMRAIIESVLSVGVESDCLPPPVKNLNMFTVFIVSAVLTIFVEVLFEIKFS